MVFLTRPPWHECPCTMDGYYC